MTDEEARAAAYLQQAVRREAYAEAMHTRLAGSTAARASLEVAWTPVVEWNDQRKEIPDAEPQEPRQWNG